jgi:hypothetical protein
MGLCAGESSPFKGVKAMAKTTTTMSVAMEKAGVNVAGSALYMAATKVLAE